MENDFFDRPSLSSPYEHPTRDWTLDATGRCTDQIIERRCAEFTTPIPKRSFDKPNTVMAIDCFGDEVMSLFRE